MYNLDNIMSDIKKTLVKEDSGSIVERIIDKYYIKVYNGCEYEKVSYLYFDQIYWELVFWLGQNMQYLKQNNVQLKKLNNFFEKHITEARIDTYKLREKIYFHWKIRSSFKESDKKEWFWDLPKNNVLFNEILQYLLKVYKMNEENFENIQYQVRKELDLNCTLDELNIKLKSLK